MLSKGDNAFNYISKTTMSSVIYAFKRRQCLHLHFEDNNVFSHLCFQKVTMPSFTFQKMTMSSVITLSKGDNPSFTFQRWQCLQPFILSKTTMSSSQRLQCLLSLCFIRLDVLYFYAFKKKKREKNEKKNEKEKKKELQCPYVSSVSLLWFSAVARSNSKIAWTKLVSLSLLSFYFQ